MSANIFGSDDPWENGWTADDSEASKSAIQTFGASEYLTSSQLLSNRGSAEDIRDNPFETNEARVPQSYKKVAENLSSKLTTVNDIEPVLLNKIVTLGYLTDFQRMNIMNVIRDNNILPPSKPDNLYKILGLIAMEIDTSGSGDYVSLQFNLNDLPDLPEKVVAELVTDQQEVSDSLIDPLTTHLNTTSLTDKDWRSSSEYSDPLLVNHAQIKSNETESNLEHDVDQTEVKRYINDIRDGFQPLINSSDLITIKEVPEKEGLLFKHINYVISHEVQLGMNGHAGVKKVIRRYADFVWLLEFMLKRYPFRIIPGLPPKKFTVGSSLDSQFLQRRRRGLHRFLNQLIKHPILRQEPVVVTFLSVPTDLSTWRKQAKVDYSLEFKGEKILTQFINSIWPTVGNEFLEDWARAERALPKLIEIWTKIVLLVERYEKRQQQIACENSKFVEMISGFKTLNSSIYPNNESTILGSSNKDDLDSINESMNSISGYFNKSSQVLVDESYAVNIMILEKFKNYLDYLYSFQELIERAKSLSANNINQLQNTIKENEVKYNKLNNDDAEIRGRDLAKLRQTIINDKQEIFQQLNKDWLIKSCCFNEFIMFQETQYLLSELWIDWLKGRSKFQEKYKGLYETLFDSVIDDMPLNR